MTGGRPGANRRASTVPAGLGRIAAMADIDVSCVAAADGWLCQVTVAEHGSESRHSVTLTRGDFQRLSTGSGESPDGLVRRCFDFLLARERKESILRSFGLTDIGRYFPEFEEAIRGRT